MYHQWWFIIIIFTITDVSLATLGLAPDFHIQNAFFSTKRPPGNIFLIFHIHMMALENLVCFNICRKTSFHTKCFWKIFQNIDKYCWKHILLFLNAFPVLRPSLASIIGISIWETGKATAVFKNTLHEKICDRLSE